MATVQEIYARLNAEKSQAPWLIREQREVEDTVLRPLDDEEYEVMEDGSLKPTRKVTVGVLAGALSLIVAYVLGLNGLVIPAEIGMAITTIVTFGLSYIVPESTD